MTRNSRNAVAAPAAAARSLRPLLLLALLAAAPAPAQCTTAWDTGPGAPGVRGLVSATETWDPDGPGGIAEGVLVGGEFAVAGKELARNVALYTPSTATWSALGAGAPGRVTAIAAQRNRVAIAHGTPTAITIALWDGVAWTSLGMTSGEVNRLAFDGSGDLFAAGSFLGIGTVAARSIARWDGAAWHPLGTGVPPGAPIRALLVLPNDDLVIGGDFLSAGGVGAARVAQWDGASWQPLGSGCTNRVQDVVRLANGDLLACMEDVPASAWSLFERWDGVSWTVPPGAPTWGKVSHATVLPTGDVYASGVFGLGSTGMSMVRWDGVVWQTIVGSAVIGDMALLSTGAVVAGVTLLPSTGVAIPTLGSVDVGNVALFDGTNWTATGFGFNDPVLAIAPVPGGVAIAGGFSLTPGADHDGIVGWDGASWSPLASGIQGQVRALRRFADGTLVAVGSFHRAGVVAADSVVRWNGAAWSAIGTSARRHLDAVAELPSGQPVVAGAIERLGGWQPYVAFFDGSVWRELPALNGFPFALAVLPNGDIVAGGTFTATSTGSVVLDRVARFDGTAWNPVGTGFDDAVMALCLLPNGDLAACGDFTFAGTALVNGVARFDGASWNPLGSGLLSASFARGLALDVLPGGDLVVGGSFSQAGGVPAANVARWNGASWAAVDQGVNGEVRALQVSPFGTLLAGGAFETAGGRRSVSLAELLTSCPSSVASYGTACVSPSLGAPLLATATTLAWPGETFHARCPASPNAFAIGVFGGASIALPLAVVDPSAVPGCQLLAAPDVLLLVAATAGTYDSIVAVPNDPTLIGGSWFHQLVQFVAGTGSPFAETAGSQGLQLTFGSF